MSAPQTFTYLVERNKTFVVYLSKTRQFYKVHYDRLEDYGVEYRNMLVVVKSPTDGHIYIAWSESSGGRGYHLTEVPRLEQKSKRTECAHDKDVLAFLLLCC